MAPPAADPAAPITAPATSVAAAHPAAASPAPATPSAVPATSVTPARLAGDPATSATLAAAASAITTTAASPAVIAPLRGPVTALLIRLLPSPATDGNTFTGYLAGLTITAYDLSVWDANPTSTTSSTGSSTTSTPPPPGTKLGSASTVAPLGGILDFTQTPAPPAGPKIPVTTLSASVFQHFYISNTGNPEPNAVATAVIIVEIDPSIAPSPYPEYPSPTSYDVQLVVERNGVTLPSPSVEYNVTTVAIDHIPFPAQYLQLAYMEYYTDPPSFNQTTSEPVAMYYILPAPPPPNTPQGALLKLDSSGQPPNFDGLVAAVDQVLALDPGSMKLENQSQILTLAQCAQIAAELVYDPSTNPPPIPISKYPDPESPKNQPPGRGFPLIDDLYTTPDQNMDNIRRTFEGSLTSYHSTNDATAQKLAGFIYAASVAVDAEQRTKKEYSASLTFPIDPSISTSNPTVSVTLRGWNNSNPVPTQAPTGPGTDPLSPPFVVPAAYFYVLGTSFPSQLSPDQRFTAIITSTEASLASQLKVAVTAGTLHAKESPLSVSGSPIDAAQAVRRLTALSASVMNSSDSQVYLAGTVASLVGDWLTDDTSETDPNDTAAFTAHFWNPQYGSGNYLDLILQIVAEGSTNLIAAIKAASLVPSTTTPPGSPTQVTTAAELSKVPVATWQAFFNTGSNSQYLPAYTQPGSVAQQVQAFIAFIRKLFTVGFSSTGAPTTQGETIPSLEGQIVADVIQYFISKYQGTFSFTLDPSDSTVSAAISSALSSSFPNDQTTQDWVLSAIKKIHVLLSITTLSPPVDIKMQFSYMEALYARGFTSAQSVISLNSTQFQAALTGTVAFGDASRIYALAGTPPTENDANPTTFTPCNPGGLVDCIPAPQYSPLGPVAYLHELLHITAGSQTLGDAVSARRGPIGTLLASKSNLETLIPRVDLILESLECLGSNLPSTAGAIYSTADTKLGDFEFGHGKNKYNPGEILDLIPEYSTPAVPVSSPAVYTTLESCWTAPTLPYSQTLDICRSYCCLLGTSRFEVMRTFRKDIYELCLDATNEPSTFQRQQWRLPVRLDTALEYLQISSAEYTALFSGSITNNVALEFFEMEAGDDGSALTVPTFLKIFGITYCEFLQLWSCKFVTFTREDSDLGFPECLPCCPKQLAISFSKRPLQASLVKLMVFVRLWKKTQERCHDKISFDTLADICNVLGLFVAGDNRGVSVNPDFIRQFIALLMLHDQFCLPWTGKNSSASETSTSGWERTQLLGIWNGSQPGSPAFQWPVKVMLSGIQHYAKYAYGDCARGPEFEMILIDNLDVLSRLAGFTTTFPWWAKPTCTLRFAQVLAKIWASNFTVGELVFLFTIEPHLDGDDPLPLSTTSFSHDHPFELPEGGPYNLEALRAKLLSIEVEELEYKHWTWSKAESVIRHVSLHPAESPETTPDSLLYLAQHFFPEQLEKEGHHVAQEKRSFRIQISPKSSSPQLWNTAPCEPFHYSANVGSDGTGELWFHLPLCDEEVFRKLEKSRQFNSAEVNAVRDLYYAPRAALAPFAFVFSNFSHAVSFLIQEPDEEKRFRFFCHQVSLFQRRCDIIAEHLAHHVDIAIGCGEGSSPCPTEDAFTVLKSLVADENRAGTSWETDAGTRPSSYSWDPVLSGNAFASLLGLCGIGLLGNIKASKSVEWAELTGDMKEFGHARDEFNVPVPGIIPSMNIMPTADQQDLVTFNNGFAIRDDNGRQLHGAEPFKVTWTGVLYVVEEGNYEFSAVTPQKCPEEVEDCCYPTRWRVTVRRGQKNWLVAEHTWTKDSKCSLEGHSACLQKGAYDISVEFGQVEPVFDVKEKIHPTSTGLELKYKGPDTKQCMEVIKLHALYQREKEKPLGVSSGLTGHVTVLNQVNSSNPPFPIQASVNEYQALHYFSTITDIRRTYQRAFKALLFVRRFGLSAHEIHCNYQSELGFMLSHPDRFAGRSYYQTGAGTAFQTHLANFDFNFFPVSDPYHNPSASIDSRIKPSPQRQAALFDWWERIFDYVKLRTYVHEVKKRPVWLLFQDGVSQQPTDAGQMIRYLGINMNLAKMVLNYYGSPNYVVVPGDLIDEIWSTRLWKADLWAINLQRIFYTEIINTAQPYLWASDEAHDSSTGNQDLTDFVRKSLLASKDAPQRCKTLKILDDGLRERARKALFTYLCGMNRVTLSFNTPSGFAMRPRDLSDLLLQDVEVGISEKTNRIEDAIYSIQRFVQRAKMGLEPAFSLDSEFSATWDEKFKSFETWVVAKRRAIYRENWIQWDELQHIMAMEGQQFLKTELERNLLAVPRPGRPMWWPDSTLPSHPHFPLTQTHELATLSQQQASTSEGIALIATPLRNARPSLLAIDFGDAANSRDSNTNSNETSRTAEQPSHLSIRSSHAHVLDSSGLSTLDDIPMWVQAAIRLGVRFVRVAAAGIPPALTYHKHTPKGMCNCIDCQDQQNNVVDEYYFWLHDSHYFDPDDAPQDPDVGTQSNTDPTTWWTNASELPALLKWKPRKSFYLFWTRVRQGRLDPPRRSTDGVPIDPPSSTTTGSSSSSEQPFLTFLGRENDSLLFSAITPDPNASTSGSGGSTTTGSGTSSSTPPIIKPSGFRYDLSTDKAVVTPPPTGKSSSSASNSTSSSTSTSSSGGTNSSSPAPPAALSAFPRFVYFEPGKPLIPTSAYGPSITMARALRSNCQFEEALRWCRNVFDPLQSDNTWAQCPKPTDSVSRVVKTEKVAGSSEKDTGSAAQQPTILASDHQGSSLQKPEHLQSERDSIPAPEGDGLRGRDLPCCPSYPVSIQIARSRAVLLEYLDILFGWTQQLLGRSHKQAIEQGMVILGVIDRILGFRPEKIDAHDSTGTTKMNVGNFIPSPAPLNPRLLEMYDLAKELRELGNNPVNLHRRYPDPLMLGLARGDANPWPGALKSPSVCYGDIGCFSRRQPYRFTSQLPKALDWASMLKNLGYSLLSAFEKGDNELLTALRATHDRQILDIGLDVAKNQWRAADWDVQVLDETMLTALTKLRYYNGLIAGGLNSGEVSYQTNAESAMQNKSAANATETEAQAMNLIPDLAFGVAGLGPYQSTTIPIGTKLSQMLSAAAQVMSRIADISSQNGALTQTQGSWQRRSQDWQNQVDLATLEIEQVKRQQAAAWRRRDIALRQLTSQTQQMDHAAEVQDFMRDKFTKHELYLFLQQETASLYRKAFDMAMQTAGQLQEAFWYERGDTRRDYLPEIAWNSLHEGLMAGEKLELALQTMGREYMNLNYREYELTKHISLRLMYDSAPFLQLKTCGYCELDIPEWMFDLDYPGHYMRRIKSVTLSIACVSGPYTGVHCRLQLLSSATRVYPFLPSRATSCCKGKDWTDAELKDPDPYLVWRHTGVDAIATSSGTDDSGLFSLQLTDEKYLPFEFSGAVSRWRIELPQENNQFALSSITDFVLHINYTAREGGPGLRKHANERAQALLPKTGLRFLDLRHEFPDAWRVFKMKDGERNGPSPYEARELPLHFSRSMFPYLTGRDAVRLTSLQLFIQAKGRPGLCRPDHIRAQYIIPQEHDPSCPNHPEYSRQHGQPPHHQRHLNNSHHRHYEERPGRRNHHINNSGRHEHNRWQSGDKYHCDCDFKVDIPCVQDECCASLYHGAVADMHLKSIREFGSGFRPDYEYTQAFIRFLERLPPIEEGYLLVGYDASEEYRNCDCCTLDSSREGRREWENGFVL